MAADQFDWPGLVRAVAASGAARAIVTHGAQSALCRYLAAQCVQAEVATPSHVSEVAGDNSAPARTPGMHA